MKPCPVCNTKKIPETWKRCRACSYRFHQANKLRVIRKKQINQLIRVFLPEDLRTHKIITRITELYLAHGNRCCSARDERRDLLAGYYLFSLKDTNQRITEQALQRYFKLKGTRRAHKVFKHLRKKCGST